MIGCKLITTAGILLILLAILLGFLTAKQIYEKKHECYSNPKIVTERIYIEKELSQDELYSKCLGAVRGSKQFEKDMWERR